MLTADDHDAEELPPPPRQAAPAPQTLQQMQAGGRPMQGPAAVSGYANAAAPKVPTAGPAAVAQVPPKGTAVPMGVPAVPASVPKAAGGMQGLFGQQAAQAKQQSLFGEEPRPAVPSKMIPANPLGQGSKLFD